MPCHAMPSMLIEDNLGRRELFQYELSSDILLGFFLFCMHKPKQINALTVLMYVHLCEIWGHSNVPYSITVAVIFRV